MGKDLKGKELGEGLWQDILIFLEKEKQFMEIN